MKNSEIALSSVVSYIERSNDNEITKIISAIIRRYEITFPDWEAVFLTLPKNNPDECKRILLKLAEYLGT